MEVRELFNKIIDNNDVKKILDNLGMRNIVERDEYFTCGQPDGDNPKSVIVYKDNLWVTAYTRDILDKFGNTNIISLTSYIRKTYFSQSVKWICDICGYNYYEAPQIQSGMIKFLDYIYSQSKGNTTSDEDEITYLKPIDEVILTYYGKYPNKMFLQDNIDLHTQLDFEIGYDLESHSITIPIRDELNTLVGVKARLYKTTKQLLAHESKYFYIVPCAKSKILYGLNKTIKYIKNHRSVIVVESEKGVLQLWSKGIKNVVAIGSHTLSKWQAKKLTHLGVDIILAYDKDVMFNENGVFNKDFYEKECKKFIDNQKIFCIFDDSNILSDKESPTDDIEKWEVLFKNKRILRGV